jgi:hypothetical protein
MRSAAVLFCSSRRGARRVLRATSARPRAAHRTFDRDASGARRAARRAPSRLAKPRERIVHVIPRGFLPLVRH